MAQRVFTYSRQLLNAVFGVDVLVDDNVYVGDSFVTDVCFKALTGKGYANGSLHSLRVYVDVRKCIDNAYAPNQVLQRLLWNGYNIVDIESHVSDDIAWVKETYLTSLQRYKKLWTHAQNCIRVASENKGIGALSNIQLQLDSDYIGTCIGQHKCVYVALIDVDIETAIHTFYLFDNERNFITNTCDVMCTDKVGIRNHISHTSERMVTYLFATVGMFNAVIDSLLTLKASNVRNIVILSDSKKTHMDIDVMVHRVVDIMHDIDVKIVDSRIEIHADVHDAWDRHSVQDKLSQLLRNGELSN